MKQEFATRKTTSDVSEDGSSIVVQLFLIESEGEVQIAINREEASRGSGNDISVDREKEIELTGVDVGTLSEIRRTVNTWIESDGKATLFESFSDVEGEYTSKKQSRQKTYGMSKGKSEMVVDGEHEFSELHLSVGREGIAFRFEVDGSFLGVVIPAAEHIQDGLPQDIGNADLLNKTLYDFFEIRLPDHLDEHPPEPATSSTDAVSQIKRVFNNFGDVARQLEERSRNREPLMMGDEYDVQYLLHGLLRLFFDDIRPETSTQRHSSVSPRIDFLIEEHKIGIEVKRASESMPPKRIRSDLAEDKEQYRKDTNIETLLCFIYDPDHHFTNPAEFETDLADSPSNLTTHVTITH